ncbi:MAG: radical SAM protein [Prevotellaceae bacterium]|jgi:uncharacterized protein|nr:radical SAM protein [Prevotellaceae bacterium]
MANAYHKRNKLFSNFIFIPSYNCNFRCPYCVEGQVSKMGKQWSKKTFKAMEEICPHIGFQSKQILLYGGEPLLKENKDIVKYIVEKAHPLGYKFKAITNGYDLEEFKDLLSPDLIYSLQITVDGTKEWHDQRRVHFQDVGTFDKIVKNIELALERGVAVTVRINTDKNNFDSITELKEIFSRLGYYKFEKLFTVYVGWLYSNDSIVPDSGEIKYFEFKELNQKLKEKKIEVCHPSDMLYSNLYKAISTKKLLSLSSTGCSSQSGAYVFDPIGNIYSCLEIVGNTKYVLGNYSDTEMIHWYEDEISKWHDMNISTIKNCSVCKYAFLCHGGCILKKIQNESDTLSCESFPSIVNIAVNKAYKAYLQEMEKI